MHFLSLLIESFAKSLNKLTHDFVSCLVTLSALSMFLILVAIVTLCGLLKLTSVFVKKQSQARFPLPSKPDAQKRPKFSVGFFHPFCNSGGGGERVLWSAIKAVQAA